MKEDIKNKLIERLSSGKYQPSTKGMIKEGTKRTPYGIISEIYSEEQKKKNISIGNDNFIEFFECIKIEYRNDIIQWAGITEYDIYILDICDIMCIMGDTFDTISKYILKNILYHNE